MLEAAYERAHQYGVEQIERKLEQKIGNETCKNGEPFLVRNGILIIVDRMERPADESSQIYMAARFATTLRICLKDST